MEVLAALFVIVMVACYYSEFVIDMVADARDHWIERFGTPEQIEEMEARQRREDERYQRMVGDDDL